MATEKEPKQRIPLKYPQRHYSNGKRAHRKTGNPNGGARPGAGRKLGVPNTLPTGAIRAIEAINVRIPDKTPEDQVTVANAAFNRVVDVMLGKVHSSIAQPVLKAATHLREEICGSITKKFDVKAETTLTSLLDEVGNIEKMEQNVLPPKGPVEPKGPIIRKKSEGK